MLTVLKMCHFKYVTSVGKNTIYLLLQGYDKYWLLYCCMILFQGLISFGVLIYLLFQRCDKY